MLLLSKYPLGLLLLLVSVYGGTKEQKSVKHKRDISDLSDDPLLTSIFSSDLKEKRDDRSISPQEQKKEDKDEKAKNDILKSVLTSVKDVRRDTEAAKLSSIANSTLQVPNSLFANLGESPLIGNQIPLSGASKLLGHDLSTTDDAATAVVPQLFQANYLPLENLDMSAPAFNGETVESVENAAKALDYKKSMIPDVPYLINVPAVNAVPSMYSGDLVKKDDIPEVLPGSEGGLEEPLLKTGDDGGLSASVDSMLNTPLTTLTNTAQQPLTTVVNSDSKSNVEAPQVQNLDGALTRPMIQESDVCSDQYASCNDFAKNQYCEKYPELMKIQCRKSCGYCVAGQKDVIEKESKSKAVTSEERSEVKNATEAAAPANATAKATEPSKPSNETKAAKKSEAPVVAAPADTKKSDTPKKEVEKAAKKSPEKEEAPVAAKTKVEAKPVATKKSKSEKHKEKKPEVEAKSKISDQESGSTTEADSQDAESGDLGSGELGSGSASGSGEEEPAIVKSVIPVSVKKSVLTATATKASTSKAKQEKSKVEKPKNKKGKEGKSSIAKNKNKITTKVKVAKSNLGEFTLPVIKSEVSTASLALEEHQNEESGSGSGSGDEAEPPVVPAKKEEVKPKAKAKPAAKKSKETKAPKHAKSKVAEPKKIKSKPAKKAKKAAKEVKAVKKSKPAPKPKHVVVSKKSSVPAKPKKIIPYPKIDLRLIASALAHYEEAALELAGEYPKAEPVAKKVAEATRSEIPKPKDKKDETKAAESAAPAAAPAATVTKPKDEDTRSFIPHPVLRADPQLGSVMMPSSIIAPPEQKKELIIDPLEKYKQNLQIAKILTDDRNGRSTIPKYLRLSKDVKGVVEEEEVEKSKADSLTAVQKRFNIIGVEPTLIDYYAETGKINPFAHKKKGHGKNVKKSSITNGDPYEYLRNMPAGASMLPIDDLKARSKIPSDHSYPVFLMKVSPGERKYIEELPRRRGEIRHLNAEGVEMGENDADAGIPKDIVNMLQKQQAKNVEPALKKSETPASIPPPAPAAPPAPALPAGIPGLQGIPGMPPGMSMLQNPFLQNPMQMPMSAMMGAAANLQKNLLQAQASIPQARTAVPNIPKAAPAKPKANVPKPKPVNNGLTDATAQAMEKSAMSIGLQYAQNQMKQLAARAKLPGQPSPNKFIQAIRGALNVRPQPVQRNKITPGALRPKSNIGALMAPQLNPAFAFDPQVNLKNNVVNAFFPAKNGLEGSGAG